MCVHVCVSIYIPVCVDVMHKDKVKIWLHANAQNTESWQKKYDLQHLQNTTCDICKHLSM